MRHATLQAKPTQQSAARIQQDPAAGPNGVSLTPPTYGLDFVDRASAEAGDVRSAGAVSVHAAPSMIIQPKLMLGPVSDQYEQEADRMARQVVERVHTATSRPASQSQTPSSERRDRPKPMSGSCPT